GIVEARGVDVVPESVDGVGGEDAVAGEEPIRVGREVLAVPAIQPDLSRAVAAVPPDLVAILAVERRAVEVAHGEVLDPDTVALPDLDAIPDLVLAVDDHPVPIHATNGQLRRRDLDRVRICAESDDHPRAG